MLGWVICLYLNYHLLQTSDALLAARQVDLALGQHRSVQPEPGVQWPGCGHHPQLQLQQLQLPVFRA